MSDYKVSSEIDVKGLKCPMPILKTKKALQAIQDGQILKVIATDPHADKDLHQFAIQTGNNILATEKDGDVYTFYIQRKQSSG